MTEFPKGLLAMLEGEEKQEIDESSLPPIQAEGHAVQLIELYEAYTKKPIINPGSLVVLDERLRKYKWPRPGQPAMVVETYKPFRDTTQERSATFSFGLRHDTTIAFFDPDGDVIFMEIWHKLLKPYQQ